MDEPSDPVDKPKRRPQTLAAASVGAVRVNATEPAESELVGEHYRLISPIRDGGMGTVWIAHNEALDINVAVKIIRTDTSAAHKQSLARRLLREARVAAKLVHPAIVRIGAYGTTRRDEAFIVMDLLDGEDLGDAMDRRGRIAPVAAVRVMLPIAHGLMFAHDRQVIHRDIKPGNIFLCRASAYTCMQPKLIDFGIAKADDQPQSQQRLTAAGVVMGSPGYMSPEQARGDDVDERADIWSFTTVLYEMITGRLPFRGTDLRLLNAIINDPAKPITDFGVGDAALWAILEKGFAKELTERWQYMRQLGVALSEWLQQQGVHEDICGTTLTATWPRKRSTGEIPVDVFD